MQLTQLTPTIVQASLTGQVLMLGYMNQAAYDQTVTSGLVTFWSRSKNRLWQKGETSGNVLKFISADLDCDNDTLLIQAEPQGPTCHTESQSCFAPTPLPALFSLFAVIQERQQTLPDDSYTAQLFKAGTNKILSKVAEESAEVLNAVLTETPERLTEESADLLYHLFVLLAQQNVELKAVVQELQQRNRHKKA